MDVLPTLSWAMQFVQAGYVVGASGDVKTYTKEYSREISLLWTGMVTERVEVLVDVHSACETVVRINKDGRQVLPSRALHLYKSEGVAFAAVKATMEWMGYIIYIEESAPWGQVLQGVKVEIMKAYAAYGSNINLGQMAHRCPAARVIGKGWLMDYQLMFQGMPGGRGVATVEPHKGRRVPILLWAFSPDCEVALDRYEGYPTQYRKETLPVAGIEWLPNEITDMPTDVTEVPAMIYIMNVGEVAAPSDYYLDTIVQGYRSVGFHVRYLAEGVRRTHRQKIKLGEKFLRK